MPVYNGERWLRESIPSVLDQTFDEFELLIIDDGSTDATSRILDDYASRDARIRVLSQENHGIVDTLNRALREARYDWVARLDADDLAYPNRLERQLAFVQEHPDLAACGSFAHYINADGALIGETRNPFTTRARVEQEIAAGRMIYFLHPSMMLRRDKILDLGGYREEFPLSHDVDLWNRVAEARHKVLAQPEFLVAYRIHDYGMTRRSFRRLAEELRWSELCARQRRRRESEPSLDQFRAAMRRTPLPRRFNSWREDTAFVGYKTATAARARGGMATTAGYLALSAALDPVPTAKNVWRKAVRPRVRRLTRGKE